jgi:hypothetical protein
VMQKDYLWNYAKIIGTMQKNRWQVEEVVCLGI